MNEPMNTDSARVHSSPEYLLTATRCVLAEREKELLALKGRCSNAHCSLHYAHYGPCNESRVV
jgi:hypothetical protein